MNETKKLLLNGRKSLSDFLCANMVMLVDGYLEMEDVVFAYYVADEWLQKNININEDVRKDLLAIRRGWWQYISENEIPLANYVFSLDLSKITRFERASLLDAIAVHPDLIFAGVKQELEIIPECQYQALESTVT